MVTFELDYNKLIQDVSDLIIKNKGQLPYTVLRAAIDESYQQEVDFNLSWYQKVLIITFASCICTNIPLVSSFGGLKFETIGAVRRAMTFYFTARDEISILRYSNTKASKLPPLKYTEDTHDIFESGAGTCAPDFIDNSGLTYEVKFNYFELKSPSSLHRAKRLLNCIPGQGVFLWSTKEINYKAVPDELLLVIPDILIEERKGHYKSSFMNSCPELWNVLYNNEFNIYDKINKDLKDKGFIWKK